MDRIEDNSRHSKKAFIERYPKLSNRLLDKSLKTLSKEENMLIFPNDLEDIADLDHKQKIIKTLNYQIQIQNTIGFIGAGDEQLEIFSRFSKDQNHFFLHYMLQQVLNINIVDLNTKLSMEEKLYHFLIYLFPKYLNTAMRKGIFKEYRRVEYNNTSIKGSIDIARHIKRNTPFTGNIAYSTREFSQDNNLMQLIRHTIEFIRSSTENGKMILNSSENTKNNISAVILATPSYHLRDKRKIIIENKTNGIRHAYYTEYRKLQKLCLMILTYRQHSLGGDRDDIHGLLFDVAWLWEEYIHTLLNDHFIHACNNKRTHGLSVYESTFGGYHNRTVFPDFYSKDHQVIADAKYKRLDSSINREDLYQIITYSYLLKAKSAGVIYPTAALTKHDLIGKVSGYGVNIFRQSLQIPQDVSSYKEFALEIKKAEKVFKKEIDAIL